MRSANDPIELLTPARTSCFRHLGQTKILAWVLLNNRAFAAEGPFVWARGPPVWELLRKIIGGIGHERPSGLQARTPSAGVLRMRHTGFVFFGDGRSFAYLCFASFARSRQKRRITIRT